MKKYLFLALLSFWLIPDTFAQAKGQATHLIKYELTYAMDSTNRDSRTLEIDHLYSGPKVSLFASEGNMLIDSLFKKMENSPRMNWQAMQNDFKKMSDLGFALSVYKDLSAGKVYVESRLSETRYVYPETKAPVVWEFADESKEIGDYTAQKATTSFGGRIWEAWFTLEVPITDGPYVFSGLPGLILELTDTDKDYSFNVISIQQLETPFEIDSEKGEYKEVSKDNFIKAYKSFRENPFGPYANQIRNSDFQFPDPFTGEMTTGAEFARRMKREVDRKNNYIERW